MKSTKTLSVIALSLAAVLATAPAQAASKQDKYASNKNVAVGMGTGIVIGSIVAGPAGAAIAGLFGAMLGNDTYQEAELQASQQALSKSQRELFAMRDALEDMQQEARATHVAFEESQTEKVMAIETSVQFKTGSYAVEPAFARQLELIADALKAHPQLQARLTGHADNRGDEKYNQALSMQRALSVKAYLSDKGVDSKQILTVAVGEEDSMGNSMEDAFFDRRVVVQVADNQQVLTAAR